MRGTPPYVELHCHSAYSFLDGVSLPDELAHRAAELGYAALALTDHNSVSGSMELAQVAEHMGVRAIHGAEVDLRPDSRSDPSSGAKGRGGGVVGGANRGHGKAVTSDAGADHRPGHLTLLVQDARGWRNLCRILTAAHAHTRERRERGDPAVDLQTVIAHSEGLVCLTGCAGHGVHDEPTARHLLDAFGPERLRVELQRPYSRHDRAHNRALERLARRLGVACVATGDVHAHARSRAELQDAFVALRHRTTLDASEPLRRGNHAHVMSAPQAMVRRFADHPRAVRESVLLAEQLRFDLTKDLGYSYPGSEDEDALRRLAELCLARLEERYPRGAGRLRAEAQRRLEEELRVIDRLALAGFFLLHHEMLVLAREVAIEVRGPDSVRALLAPGRGRGSSVSSIVCYLTGLSHIDPVANRLLLGRFLHEDLHGLPDIDLDFPREIREVLIPRVHERFGSDRAALVAAFPTFRARGAIRELGKVLGLAPGVIERVARMADSWGRDVERDIDAAFGVEPAAADASFDDGPSTVDDGSRGAGRDDRTVDDGSRGAGRDDRTVDDGSRRGARRDDRTRSVRWRWLARLAEEAYGLPRHLSQHPGGMVVATRPLIDCCPVAPAAMQGRQMVQWDKDSCADAGFLKIDLLGLGMLSAVERCVQEIDRTRGKRIDLSRIPFDDPETFDAIRDADTVGVFQIESRAQMQSLKRTRPSNLDDLTIQVAIVRPGPIQGGAVNPYIERRRRLLADPGYEPSYEHPSLEPVLRDTLGTIIFQDQVVQVAEAFAGLSPGEADGLRRAMSRKRSLQAMEGNRERFIAGALRHSGADPQTAARVWEMVSGFAGFGFPKAHAAAFGLLAYQSTWLRVHYGPEFLCALLNEQPMGFYAPDSLIHEAQRRGIAVLGLDVNASEAHCTVDRGAVRLGLGYVKGAVASEVVDLVAERRRGGPFRNLGDLAGRVAASRATLEQLAWSGACDGLVDAGSAADAGSMDGESMADAGSMDGWSLADGGSAGPVSLAHARRRVALWQLGLARPGERAQEGVQLALPLELPPAPRLPPLDRWQRLIADYATSGVTAHDHAMAILRPRLAVPMLATSAQLGRLPSGCSVTVAGLVIARQRPGAAKGTMFLLFEDEWGVVNLIVPRAVYERRRPLARAEPLLLACGRLERSSGVTNVIVSELAALERHLLPAKDDEPGTSRLARVRRLPTTAEPSQIAAGLRAVVPPVQSFAAGRRR
jgi:error-prone DNA polymerase